MIHSRESRIQIADSRESRFRMTAAWLMTLAGFLGLLGGTWDIQWHAAVGPDSFFTPSHGLLYASRALSGFIALYVVIRTTIEYRRGNPAVTDATTTPWLTVLRAPVGFVVAGMGVLSFIAGGLYDLWWHTIYGFDVTLLSPSHFAIGFGGIVVTTGVFYIFASEANRQAARGDGARLFGFGWADLGAAMAGASVISNLGAFTQPGLGEAIFAGPLLVYPIAMSLAIALGLFAAAGFLRRPGSATLTALVFTGFRLVALYWPPLMVEWERLAEGLPYKVHAFKAPVVGLTLPAYLLLVGLVVDVLLYLGGRFGWHTRLSVALAAAVGTVVNLWVDPRVVAWVKLTGGPQMAGTLARVSGAMAPSMAVAVLVAVAVAWFGWGVGNVLRHTDK